MDSKHLISLHIHKNVLKIGTLFVCLFACVGAHASDSIRAKSKWLDDYPKHVGLTYVVGTDIMSNYIWRGRYVAGLGIQPTLNVGYGGLYIETWWNIGAEDWTFSTTPSNGRVKAFHPEADVILGFSRWGLTIQFFHMYYFDTYSDGTHSRYFDFSDPQDGVGGVTQEWPIKYRVSDKLPLSLMFCTRTWGRDGYNDADGTRHRAYSSYIEVGYDFKLPHQLVVSTRIGMTPWKSFYTNYQGDFAVINIDNKLSRNWDISDKLRINAFAQLMLNPYDISRMAQNAEDYRPLNGERRCLWNMGCGIYLK